MRARRGVTVAVLVAGALGAMSVEAEAQWGRRRGRAVSDEPLRDPVAWLNLGGELAIPKGVFADYIDLGGGMNFHMQVRPRGSPLALRLGGHFLIYGSSTRRYGLLPGVDVDVTTTHSIIGMSIGPQIHWGRGAMQLYGFGGVGFSYFSTTSSASGSSSGDAAFAHTTNHEDFTFATEGGGGLLVRLGGGRTPVYLDLGARYLENGVARYVTNDGLAVVGNELVVTPVESEANLIVYQVGVSIGLRARNRRMGDGM